MKTGFVVLLTYNAVSLTAPHFYHKSPVVLKQGVADYANSFNLGVRVFKELIAKNKMFIDNSMFIREAVNPRRSIYMIGARKCGRSVNLDMLKTFLEIPVDDRGNRIQPREGTDNYRLFMHGDLVTGNGTAVKMQTPMMIRERDSLIRRHAGKYPIVYVDFSDVKGRNAHEVKQDLRRAVARAYRQHQYMINVFEIVLAKYTDEGIEKSELRYTLSTFEKIINNASTDDKPIDLMISQLCKILREHYGRKVIIFYDDYDKPLTNILQLQNFPERDLDEITGTMRDIAATSLHDNQHKDVFYVSGTFELPMPSQNDRYPPRKRRCVRQDLILESGKRSIAQYFDLSDTQVLDLFEKHNLPSSLSDRAKAWYKSFRSDHYNLHSVLNFLNSKTVENFFTNPDVESVALPLLGASAKARNTIISFLSEQTLTITLSEAQRKLDQDALRKLKPQIFDPNATYDSDANSLFIWYLLRNGYLGVRRITQPEILQNPSEPVEIGLLNKEVATVLCSWLISSYQRKYHVAYEILQNAAASLSRFVDDPDSGVSPLEGCLGKLYNRSWSYLASTNDTAGQVEDPFADLFTCVTMQMQYASACEIYVAYPRHANSSYAVYNNRTGWLVLLRVNRNDETIESAFNAVQNNEADTLVKFDRAETLRLVVVKIWPNKTVQVYTKIRQRNATRSR